MGLTKNQSAVVSAGRKVSSTSLIALESVLFLVGKSSLSSRRGHPVRQVSCRPRQCRRSACHSLGHEKPTSAPSKLKTACWVPVTVNAHANGSARPEPDFTRHVGHAGDQFPTTLRSLVPSRRVAVQSAVRPPASTAPAKNPYRRRASRSAR